MTERTQDDFTDVPYNGLFGDTNQIRVIRQVIADPFGTYRPKELQALIEASAPSVRDVLKNLTNAGLLLKDIKDRQHPIYRVNINSPIYLALTFLAFAIPDHQNGTHYLEDVIADYYDSELREKYEICEFVTEPMTTLSYLPDNHPDSSTTQEAYQWEQPKGIDTISFPRLTIEPISAA